MAGPLAVLHVKDGRRHASAVPTGVLQRTVFAAHVAAFHPRSLRDEVMFPAYNTNGLPHHDPLAAVAGLARIGYRGVALTVDHYLLAPNHPHSPRQLADLKAVLDRYGLDSAIETGGRFLLDPWRKHEPSLMTADSRERRRRLDFYRHAVDCAVALGSRCVSLWSGRVADDPSSESALWERLTAGLRETCEYAADHNIKIAFEPEPDMWIDTTEKGLRLLDRVRHPNLFLTLDIGHLQCQGELPVGRYLRLCGERLIHVHLDDARRGTHEHLMLGQGEVDWTEVLRSLHEMGYQGALAVELSRHGHLGLQAAAEAYAFLKPRLDSLPRA